MFVFCVRVHYQVFIIWILKFDISPSACNFSLKVSKKLALRRSNIFFRPIHHLPHPQSGTGFAAAPIARQLLPKKYKFALRAHFSELTDT
jgi:hypothetical protein